MRKSLILTLLLAALSVGTLACAHGLVNRARDDVSLDETAVWGDTAAAEGLVVISSTQCGNHLFWDTVMEAGEPPSVSTAFMFSQAEKRADDARSYRGVVIMDGTFNPGGVSSGGGIALEDRAAPIQAVASRTAPGEEHTEEVYIKDYYDFYPLEFELDLPGAGTAVNEQTRQVFSDYFRIPVWSEHKAQISILKSGDGTVHSIGISSVSDHDVQFVSDSVLTESGCFFTLNWHTSAGALLDASHIPGGYGVYYFPYEVKNNMAVPAADALETVFAVDPQKVEIILLRPSADKSALFLVTEEDGRTMLTVLDAKTAAPRQKLALFDAPGGDFRDIFIYDDFIVPIAGDRLAVVSGTAGGEYALQFTADTGEAEIRQLQLAFSPAMDFDGSRLAIAAYMNNNNFCSFGLAVYDRDGLKYYGEYVSSLDKGAFSAYEYMCKPAEDTPLSVTWTGR